ARPGWPGPSALAPAGPVRPRSPKPAPWPLRRLTGTGSRRHALPILPERAPYRPYSSHRPVLHRPRLSTADAAGVRGGLYGPCTTSMRIRGVAHRTELGSFGIAERLRRRFLREGSMSRVGTFY